jgi:hypothetical protein
MGHADKRSVSTDALETLGTIIGPGQGRDAIHLAVEPAVAAQRLSPGEDVGFVDGGVGKCENPVGIVDPFIKGYVKKGEHFWLVVYPRQITSLRHVWTHPAFPDSELPPITEADRENARRVAERLTGKSEKWLREFCANADCPGYEAVMAAAMNCEGDEYLHFGGQDAHGEIPSEFWDHFEVVTGKKIKNRPTFFSCSC